MKKESLQEFEFGLTQLEKYIKYNSACNRVISDSEGIERFNPESTGDLFKASLGFQRKKIFEYNSYIISLYGLFERFLENILKDYLTDICLILKSFENLPNNLKNKMLNANVDILRNLSNPKFQGISIPGFISNMHKSLNENKALLNIEAFQHHPYNFKQSIISEYFGNIGITGLSSSLKTYEPLNTLLMGKYGDPARIDSDVIYKIIDDLALRRNDVAHGVENVVLLNASIVNEYIEFIRAYSITLFNILQNEAMGFLFGETPNNFGLIGVINNSIVCGSIQSMSISKSDYVLVEKPSGNFPKFELLQIENIQVNKVTHDKLTVIELTNIGLKVNGHIKENYIFKIVTSLSR